MRLVWKAFSLCKEGNREEENEDAIFPALLSGTSMVVDKFSCAMSDGATSSSFSRLWAGLLVKQSALSDDLQRDFSQAVSSARTSWKSALPEKDLPWPVVIKIRQGSYATLLWFHLWQHQNGSQDREAPADHGWVASAVGDTCLFRVNRGRFVSSFPLTRTDQFSNTPDLISTNLNSYRSRLAPVSLRGSWQKGDHFLIASDALAQWMIRNIESGSLAWPAISENLTSLVRYQTWIRSLRRQGLIKNDDTSLISMTVED